MQNKCMTILLLVLLVPFFSFGQRVGKMPSEKKLVIEKSVTDLNTTTSTKPSITLSSKMDPSVGEEIELSDYDTWSNGIIRDQVVVYNGVPYFANMVRPYLDHPATQRNVVFTTKDAQGNWLHVSVNGGQAGWPQIDAQLTGTADARGTIGIVYHTPDRLALWDATNQSFTLTSPIETGVASSTDPSFQFLGDTLFAGTSRGRTGFGFFKSIDYGGTYEFFDSIQTHTIFVKQRSTEVGMSKSENENNLAYFSSAVIAGNFLKPGIIADSIDNVWVLSSTDRGSTFNFKKILLNGDTTAVEGYESTYAPLVTNFGQLDLTISNNGLMQAVGNGYGYVTNDPNTTAYRFPIVYWNSNKNKWKVISDHNMDILPDTIAANIYPGSNLGQSYPTIAASPDGQVVFVAWVAPEVRGGQVMVDAGSGTFYTDIYYTYSTDGGNTFAKPAIFAGADNVAENLPCLAQHLEVLPNNTFRAHMVYLKDLASGQGISSEGALTMNPIMYQTKDIQVTVGVNDPVVVNTFKMDQNYPNPFNPSTKISFSIAERSNVTLKVFDVLGREVATLVNGQKESGSYTVDFNASKLASGLYVYTLNAGSNTVTKKMMLMK